MTRAEILTIGTELLLGEIVDTNTRVIAIALRENGYDLFRTATVGDNPERIALAVSDAFEQSEVLITAGGLGPTVDDVTREGIAQALGLELEFRDDLWEQIVERFKAFGRKPTENNRRQATLPVDSIGIENQVGTAPGFIAEKDGKVVIALPGVPAELEYLLEHEVLPYLRKRLGTPAVIKSRTVRTAGLGESWLDERIEDLERMTNPTVGLAAHPGRVDIRITAKAGTEMEVDQMLWKVEATLQQRLGHRIYGSDRETLESVALASIAEAGYQLAVLESGTGGALTSALTGQGIVPLDGDELRAGTAQETVFAGGEQLEAETSEKEGAEALAKLREQLKAQVGLFLRLQPKEDGVDILILFQSPETDWRKERSFGGPLPNAAAWAVSIALDSVRRQFSPENAP